MAALNAGFRAAFVGAAAVAALGAVLTLVAVRVPEGAAPEEPGPEGASRGEPVPDDVSGPGDAPGASPRVR